MRSTVCVALLSLCAVLGEAQTPGSRAATSKKPAGPGVLRSVTVKGNTRYSSEAIAKEIGWKIGQAIAPPDIESARTKLQSTELFNSVSDGFRYSGSPLGYDVTFTVVENDQLFPMRFERLGAAPEAIQSCLK